MTNDYCSFRRIKFVIISQLLNYIILLVSLPTLVTMRLSNYIYIVFTLVFSKTQNCRFYQTLKRKNENFKKILKLTKN